MTFIKRTIRPIVFSILSVLGGVTLGATLVGAVTTISTAIVTAGDITTTAGALSVNGISTLTGLVTTGAGITVTTVASTTQLKVGSDQISTISGMIFGYCTIPDTALTASTTTYADCTGATGVNSNYRVFVQATSSMAAPVIIQAASSSVITAGTITVRLLNTGLGTTTAGGISPTSINFWAVR